MWALPLLPLLGFVLNGALVDLRRGTLGPADPSAAGHDDRRMTRRMTRTQRSRDAAQRATTMRPTPSAATVSRGLVSIIGPLVLIAAFGLAVRDLRRDDRGAATATPFIQRYFAWMPVGDLHIDAAFQLDQLSMVMVLVITGVGTLIHIFSVGYMRDDPGTRGTSRTSICSSSSCWCWCSAPIYPVTFVGWEGVGLCSYLLIGFWFSDRANADAGKKAFIANRVGDFGFLIAMFLLFANIGTLDYTDIAAAAPALTAGGALVTTICLFLLPGLHRQERADPALRLAARRHGRPDAGVRADPRGDDGHGRRLSGRRGRRCCSRSRRPRASRCASSARLTALFAATIGLKQWDIKKVLAYSTISQLGYMFVGGRGRARMSRASSTS